MVAKKSSAPKYAADQTHRVPLDQLRLAQRNPRKGNVGAVAASLSVNGQYRPLVANIGTHTGRANEILKGNHTLRALRQLAQKHPDDERWSTASVHFVDVDDEQALRIIAVDNATSEKGGYDNSVLADLLGELNDSSIGLAGTGFTPNDLGGLLEDPEPYVDPEAYTDPDPEPDAGGRGNPIISYSIVFDTDEEKAKWVEFMGWLKRRYPDQTPGERIASYIEHRAVLAGETGECAQ
jgi:hypothetical protein